MRYEDSWSVPKDEVDDFDRSRESREQPKRPKRPAARLTDLFWDCWTVSREKRVDLSIPWSVKRIFASNLKRLLEEHTEDEVAEMIRVFFRKVDTRALVLRNPELWKDFWYNRAALYTAVRKTAAVEALEHSRVGAHNDRIMERFR